MVFSLVSDRFRVYRLFHKKKIDGYKKKHKCLLDTGVFGIPIQWYGRAVQPVFNPFSQFPPQLELYSQLQLSLFSDPVAFSVPKSTW